MAEESQAGSRWCFATYINDSLHAAWPPTGDIPWQKLANGGKAAPSNVGGWMRSCGPGELVLDPY